MHYSLRNKSFLVLLIEYREFADTRNCARSVFQSVPYSALCRKVKIDGPLARMRSAHVTRWTSGKAQVIGRQAPIDENIITKASLLGVATHDTMERWRRMILRQNRWSDTSTGDIVSGDDKREPLPLFTRSAPTTLVGVSVTVMTRCLRDKTK